MASLSSTGVKSVAARYNMDFEPSTGNLLINDVSIKDEGAYTCHAFGSIMTRVEVKLSVYGKTRFDF